MARSLKKGPFVQESLQKKIAKMNTEQMVGHKLGEFAPTRLFRGHAGQDKTAKRK